MQQKEPPADKPYKKHLDEAASHPTEDHREKGMVEKAVETVCEYLPAAAGTLQSLKEHNNKGKPQAAAAPSSFPERPHHDEHIENFVREQHRQDGQKIWDGQK